MVFFFIFEKSYNKFLKFLTGKRKAFTEWKNSGKVGPPPVDDGCTLVVNIIDLDNRFLFNIIWMRM